MHWSKHQRQLPVIGHQPLTFIAASGLLLVLTREDLDAINQPDAKRPDELTSCDD